MNAVPVRLLILREVLRGMFPPQRMMLPYASVYGIWQGRDAAWAIFLRREGAASITRSYSVFIRRKVRKFSIVGGERALGTRSPMPS